MLAKVKPKQKRLFLTYKQHQHAQFRNEQSSNDYVSSLCKQKLFRPALDAFHFLRTTTHFVIFPSTYAHLLSACASLKSLHHGQTVHDHLLHSGSEADVVLNNHIINMYGKCGSTAHARRVFDTMPEKNAVSWGSMIAGYSHNHCDMEALDLYTAMLRIGLSPDHFTLASIIKACYGSAESGLGKQLHCHVIKSEFGFHSVVQNALIAMYAKFDSIQDAVTVYEKMEEKDLISWGSVIAAYSQLGHHFEALCHFREMISLDVHRPNEFIFGSAFSACGSLSQLEYGKQLHALCMKFGFGGDPFSGCSLCNMYAKCASIESAKQAFYQIGMPDLASWNAIITGLSYTNNDHEAMHFFSNMRTLGLKPDYFTVSCLLCAFSSCSSFQEGQQVHSFILKTGFVVDIQVHNALLNMYVKCSELSNVYKVFEEIKGRWDIVSWNTLLTACIRHNQPNEVLRLVEPMQVSAIKFDQISLSITLVACSSLATSDVGSQVHAYAMKSGLDFDLSVANSLIDMYAKCGSLDDANKMFKLISNPDAISWSSLIMGYAQFGYGREALELFSSMQASDIKPTAVTFVGVLSACSRFGLVDEGLHYFNVMVMEHGISPTRELCSCMVDLLARVGRLEDAEKFITRMPIEPDIIAWKTLLAACRVHKHVEIGKRAAENILKLDPTNSAAYVLLCSIYASTGCWDEVRKMRKLMKSRGVEKAPGQSWIKVGGDVHVFSVEDRSHFKSDMIHDTIGNLFLQMRDIGYLPNRTLT